MSEADFVVCGGGVIGASLAFGLQGCGRRVILIDGPDLANRPSRGNFGLVWVHGKGMGMRPYARWSLASANLWTEYASELNALTGIDCGYRRTGGVWITTSEEEFAGHKALIARLHAEAGAEGYNAEILSRDDIERVMPGIGPQVPGGSWSDDDGEVNPLALLHALHRALALGGTTRISGANVTAVAPAPGGGFRLTLGERTVGCERLVIAAGLGSRPLAAMLGMAVPVAPNRGQILVTERIAPHFGVTSNLVRQTPEGSILIGATMEDVGEDDRVTRRGLRHVANLGALAFPFLRKLRVVRSWAALRVLTPDGYPVYDEIPGHRGAFVVTAHSGITLSAAHARILAPAIAAGGLPDEVAAFSAARFASDHAARVH
ncbi:MAG TPA: FAD-dependent oxidoreductase [Burkholderiaceae bacterium]